MATDSDLSGLLDELRLGGELDSHGRFTLDRAQARAKMQKFQLADPRRYVLELVQAAVLRGAQTIDFAIDADDMHMRFDGRPFTAAELDELWGSIFADGDGPDLRGLRQLALGLNAALGLGPRRIVVHSGDQELRLVPGRDDLHTTRTPAIAGTAIHVEQRLRPGLLVEFFRNLRGRLGEEVHLRERCCHATQTITLDGKRISHGLAWPDPDDVLAAEPFAEGGIRGVCVLTRSLVSPQVRLLKDGVWLDTHPLRDHSANFIAIVEGDRLRKDVSLAKIVADEALQEIEQAVRAARWTLYLRLLHTDLLHLSRVRAEALHFMTLREIRELPAARAIAEVITWTDARTAASSPPISLVALADAVAAAMRETEHPRIRCAFSEYNALTPADPPIPRVDPAEVVHLTRLLECPVDPSDLELERANKREFARRVWLQRVMEPVLPAHRAYIVRGELTGVAVVRGQVGIAEQALTSPDAPAPGTAWLVRHGRVLTAFPFDWGIPGLDVAVEALFEPDEFYTDAVRDGTVLAISLHVLAALHDPLLQLAAAAGDGEYEPAVRGLVKAWLSLVLCRSEREALWQRFGVPADLWPAEESVQTLLPTPVSLRTDPAFLALRRLRLFEDLDGARRSIADLDLRLLEVGRLHVVDRSAEPVPGVGPGVLRLGSGDRKIVAALFGDKALSSYARELMLARNKFEFEQQPVQTIAARANDLRARAAAAGHYPTRWVYELEQGDIEAALMLAPPGDGGLADTAAQIDLLVDGRPITTRSLYLGFGPIVGVATSPRLQPAVTWKDVADDAGLTELIDALRGGVWALVNEQARAGVSLLYGPTAAWLRPQLLARLKEGSRDALLQHAPDLYNVPLFATLAGAPLSLADVDRIVAAHGEITWVPPWTLDTPLLDPPVVRDQPDAIDALRGFCGADRIGDGNARVATYWRERRLADLPRVDAIKLDPAAVWQSLLIAGGIPPVTGEIGLSKRRSGGGLRLELCSAGRRLGVFTDPKVPAPVDAILADDEVVINEKGQVDITSTRHKQCMRRCRRMVPTLITALAKQFEALAPAERESARPLLLDYLTAMQERESTPGKGPLAVRELPLFIDVWGDAHTLAAIEDRAQKTGTIDVLTTPKSAPPGSKDERLILVVDPPARRCLEKFFRLNVLDDQWDRELQILQAIAEAPPCTVPNLREVAWVHRRATLAGNLTAHLWIPRDPHETPKIKVAAGGREAGWITPIADLPCAGIVTGLRGFPRQSIGLERRQRSSLAKQVCHLYQELAKLIAQDRLPAREREHALQWLARAHAALAGESDRRLANLGKPFVELREALAEIVPPALRSRPLQPPEPPSAPEAKPSPNPPLPPKIDLSPKPPPRKRDLSPTPPPTKPPPSPAPQTPSQQLIALVHAELEWARARHGSLLDRLRLNHIVLGQSTDRAPGLARFDRKIILHRHHPLIARLLSRLERGQAVDPIDLTFVAANVYTLMNDVATTIEAEDEQAFVAQLAAGLATALAGD